MTNKNEGVVNRDSEMKSEDAGVREVDPGHVYELPSYDGGSPQLLVFMKREGEGYPFNVGHHPGTNLQSIYRAAIWRHQYLQSQEACPENPIIIRKLRECIWHLEIRAAQRHGRTLPDLPVDIENVPICKGCGHIGCIGNHRVQSSSSPSVESVALEQGNYPNTIREDLDKLLKAVRSAEHHTLWPGEVGIAEITIKRVRELLNSHQPTDSRLDYEDELLEDISKEAYSAWFDRSQVVDGVRMGPPLESVPVLPQADGSMTAEQLNRAALIAESRGIDLETAQELVYLQDIHAALPQEALTDVSIAMAAWLHLNPNATATVACFELMKRVEKLLTASPLDEVGKALEELREMFPDAACSIEHVYRSGFGTPTPDEQETAEVYESRYKVWVNVMSRGEAQTLSEAMAKVRQWKQEKSRQ